MFPDKALDILDEVGSRIHMKKAKMPESIIKLEEKAKKANEDKKNAVLKQDYEKAAEFRDRALKLKKEVELERERWKEESKNNRTPVTKDEVLEVTSLITGIPVSEVNEEETERLAKMPSVLKSEVIGQDSAIDSICTAIQRSRIGLSRKNKPIGNFLLVGTTGTGKTLLAKTLATYLFGTENSLIRFDMSELMEKHSVSRLIGAPPGYVGYEEGGQLVEYVKRKPYSVVLFDEIEKAHRDVYNTLLQVMDEGFLTDSLGRKVNFRNCVIMMTSNVGAKAAQDFGGGIGFSRSTDKTQKEKQRDLIEKELKRHFSPEFLNRIDEIIHFNNLDKQNMEKIVKIQLEDVKERVQEIGYHISFAKSAVDYLVDLGFDPKYGARSLARTVQNYIENKISDLVINKKIQKGNKISVTHKKDSNDFVLTVK
jgi:ATP-dependent Clp protease ATP-binding subunit ClpC